MTSPPRPRPSLSPGPSSGPSSVGVVLGVLGGVAAGKSRVARLLAGKTGIAIHADEIAAEVLASPEVTECVRIHFGPGALGPDGTPDRAALAKLVFDPKEGEEARQLLEGWTHPRIRARILARLLEARAAGVRCVALDIPLLLENDAAHGLVRQCDALVYVDVDPETRDLRARRTRGWAPGEVARREAAQIPPHEKRDRADFVVPNNGSPEELEDAVEELRRRLGVA